MKFNQLISLALAFQLHRVQCQVFLKSAGKIVKASGTGQRNTTTAATPAAVAPGPAFLSGHLYSICTNGPSGKYFTIDGNSTNVVVSDWFVLNNDSQKWLAIQVGVTSSFRKQNRRRTSPSPPMQHTRFILVPRTEQNGTAISTLDQLNSNTKVLTLHSASGNLTIEAYEAGASSQQWIPELIPQKSATASDEEHTDTFLIRSYGNGQCVKNFDHKQATIFQKIASFINRIRQPVYKPKPLPNPLSTLDCNEKDPSQHWVIEKI